MLLTQVGSGNISVVSPPGPYENNDPQSASDGLPHVEAPPVYYSEGTFAFSDSSIRRSESRAASPPPRPPACVLRSRS